jgi:signal transduction histidine kinase
MNFLRILAVDDDIDMRISILDALDKFEMHLPYIEDKIDFIIDIAETGEQALSKARRFSPDILLVDYKLPDINVGDLLDRLESASSVTLSVILCQSSAYNSVYELFKKRVFDFIQKPLSPDEIKSVVSKAAYSILLSRQLKKINEERQQMRDQYVAVLTHELKSPLAAIESYLNLMNEKTLGSDIEKYEQIIKKCISRSEYMRKLIYDLLEMTKIESNKRVRELKVLNLYEIACQSIENSSTEAIKNNISIHLDSEPEILINADKEEMEILFNNLITNAVKYNYPNGSVFVVIKKQNDSITISVKDTGIGLSEEDIKKLFKKFVRIKNKRTSGILGTGLGLSTVKTIVDFYGGNIEALKRQAEEGKEELSGSTFIVTLTTTNS